MPRTSRKASSLVAEKKLLGTTVAHRFRLIAVLGHSTHNVVYLCRDKSNGMRQMALKIVRPSSKAPERARADLVREYAIGQKVRHENLVSYGSLVDADGVFGFTTEFVPQGTLAKYIARSSFPTMPDAIQLLAETLSALHALHTNGVIHHDLKPSNLLLTHRKSVKICDFGISRLIGESFPDEGRNRRGSPHYMAPEYLEHGLASPQSDIFSVGVLAYELLCHELPFPGRNVEETIRSRFRHIPVAPHRVRPDCPPRVGKAVMKALALDPAARFQTAEDMREALCYSWLPRVIRKFGSALKSPSQDRPNEVRPDETVEISLETAAA